jgi:hypothetical protein
MRWSLLNLFLIVAAASLFLTGCSDPRAQAQQAERMKALEAQLELVVQKLDQSPRSDPDVVARLDRRMAELESNVDDILTAMEFLAIDVDGIKRNTWETLKFMQTEVDGDEPEAPDEYRRLFDPAAREKLKEVAAEKGVMLFDDRVEVAGLIIQNRAMLEFLAVVSGGKEHEAIIAVTGNSEHGKGMPKGLAGMVNACILALGFEKGTPVRASRDGKVLPPEGETIYVYVEWEGEGGKTVRARAEDLVYNLEKKKPMGRRKWVYVGSRFERDYGTSAVVYMADLTGDLVATYSWPNTVIDNVTSEGSDDVYYTCLTPRIPEIGTKITLVLSKQEMEAEEFPSIEFDEREEDPEENDGEGSDK